MSSDTGPEAILAATGGSKVDLAIDSDDRPHLAYYDINLHGLKYLRWSGNAWAGLSDGAVADVIDSVGDVGDFTSLVLDKDGNPHISYWDYTNMAIKYAYVGPER